MSRRTILKFLLLLTAVLGSYAAVEIGWRIGQYRRLEQEYLRSFEEGEQGTAGVLARQIQLIRKYSVFDPDTGFRYQPNVEVNLDPDQIGLSPRRWKTNSHGHVSAADYPRSKAADEYRIVVIGDSFAAGVTNSVRWPEALEQKLNGARARQPGKRMRVINLARDAIGAVQFKDIFAHEASGFEPDMVLVSFVIDDLRRKPHFRGQYDAATDARAVVRQHLLDPLPWYGFYPEVLARSALGPRLGLHFHLDPQQTRFYESIDEALDVSLASLRFIVQRHPRVLLLHHPQFEEIVDELGEPHASLRRGLYERGGDLHIIRMQDRLPQPLEPHWYQLPADRHPSDRGLLVYAEAVESLLFGPEPDHVARP